MRRRRVGGGSKWAGAKENECEHKRENEAFHDSRCLRRLTSDDPEPRPSPAANTVAAARAATVAVIPAPNPRNEKDPAPIPSMASPQGTAPPTAPPRPPV